MVESKAKARNEVTPLRRSWPLGTVLIIDRHITNNHATNERLLYYIYNGYEIDDVKNI